MCVGECVFTFWEAGGGIQGERNKLFSFDPFSLHACLTDLMGKWYFMFRL
jgi:hypothetical protein